MISRLIYSGCGCAKNERLIEHFPDYCPTCRIVELEAMIKGTNHHLEELEESEHADIMHYKQLWQESRRKTEELEKLNKNLERQFVEDTAKIQELENLLSGCGPRQIS